MCLSSFLFLFIFFIFSLYPPCVLSHISPFLLSLFSCFLLSLCFSPLFSFSSTLTHSIPSSFPLQFFLSLYSYGLTSAPLPFLFLIFSLPFFILKTFFSFPHSSLSLSFTFSFLLLFFFIPSLSYLLYSPLPCLALLPSRSLALSIFFFPTFPLSSFLLFLLYPSFLSYALSSTLSLPLSFSH